MEQSSYSRKKKKIKATSRPLIHDIIIAEYLGFYAAGQIEYPYF